MEEMVRSNRSEEKAYVRFINGTDRTVEVIWITFTGAYVNYRLLEHGLFVDVNTYKGHPWIAIDHYTKDRLHIDKTFIYYPKTTREYFAEKRPLTELPPEFEARIKAVITLPMYSLRYKCLLVVRNFLRAPEDVDLLELPNELVHDLKKTIVQRNNLVVQSYVDTA